MLGSGLGLFIVIVKVGDFKTLVILPIVEVCNSHGQWRGLTISGLSILTVSLNLVFFLWLH